MANCTLPQFLVNYKFYKFFCAKKQVICFSTVNFTMKTVSGATQTRLKLKVEKFGLNKL